MHDRGVIRNRAFGSQIIDFSGLRWGNITPTDIDGMIDFGNKLFVYMEFKYGDADMPDGQRIALERQADADEAAGIPAYVLLGKHNDEGDIDAAQSRCARYYYKGGWHTPHEELTIRQAVDRIRERELQGTSR
jgi:hypothetical protein